MKVAKRLTLEQKSSLLKDFENGDKISKLSMIYGITVTTISNNLKSILGEEKFKSIREKNKKNFEKKNIASNYLQSEILNKVDKNPKKDQSNESDNIEVNKFEDENNFFEVLPILENVELNTQKDLSSQPIADFIFPRIKKIELEIKCLQDFPSWQFLSKDELNRKTIEIYTDLKIAKRFCNKEQKIIKVPNTEVFKIVAPILISRGISRIISEDNLISL